MIFHGGRPISVTLASLVLLSLSVRLTVLSEAGTATDTAAGSIIKQGIWSSAAELAKIPMAGPGWNAVLAAADRANPALATVTNKDSKGNSTVNPSLRQDSPTPAASPGV
ncbi:MAG: hypothetical protein ACM3ZC_07995 [Bacteroidota bacterium]